MVKSRSSRGILLTSNLPQLQNLIKRDPASYREEFLTQYNHYLSLLRLLQATPLAFASSSTAGAQGGGGDGTGSTNAGNANANNTNNATSEKFRELMTFIAQCTSLYPAETKGFAKELSELVLDSGRARGLGNDAKRAVVQNLVMLRNKEVISSIELLQTLFPLLPLTTHAPLRSFIRTQILSDLRVSNTPSKNHKLNRVVQSLLFNMVEVGQGGVVVGDKGRNSGKPQANYAGGSIASSTGTGNREGAEAMWAITLVSSLWKKSIWNDPKTVSIAVRACSHPNVKVQSAGMHFFLGNDDGEGDSDDEEEDKGPNLKQLEHQRIIKKKTKGDERRMRKAHVVVGKKRKEKAANAGMKVNFPALDLLHDPQRFGEDLYENLQKHDKQYSLDHKILIMQLLSRVMGAHKLCVLGFYSYIIKYLTYHQLRVTQILVSLAQSVHDLTPPDVLTPIIHKLAHEFVHPGVGSEVIAAGINSIREVSRRQPWCMEGEEDLLGDLIEYRKSRDKGVTTAARGLLQLFREVNPGLLKRRERGKAASMGLTLDQVPAFGHVKETADGIEGLELLEEHFAAARAEQGLASDEELDEDAQAEQDAKGWQDWEMEDASGSDSDSDEGWQEVSSDEDKDIEYSDSDDDEDEKKRRAAKKGKGRAETAEPEDADMDVDGNSVAGESVATTSAATEDALAVKKLSLMAQQKILTPADFALLNELKIKQAEHLAANGGGSAAKRKLATLEASKKHSSSAEAPEGFMDETDILGPRKKAKQDYEERMASIQKGREGREKYGSTKSKRREGSTPSSTTNREKKRNKPIMMAVHSRKVVQKKKASLRDKQMSLRAASEKQKKAKRH